MAFYLSMVLNIAAVTSIVMMMPLKKTDIFVKAFVDTTEKVKLSNRSIKGKLSNHKPLWIGQI
ncbi:hypothetical protein VN0234_00010 [Helicobacter pylori]